MNGQTARLELCRQILTGFDIRQIVETGTFRGTTTEWFAQFGRPVVTFEVSERFATFSELRLRKYPNVQIVRGNSVDGLRTLLHDGVHRMSTVFYYLDAHWGHYLPLADELRLITAQSPRAIVLIDDFAVAGDADYEFDDYGPGKVLNLDYLVANGFRDLSVFFPATPARLETGRRRGYVLLTADPNHSAALARLAHLRAFTYSREP
jgi:hypothetical protein